MKRRTICLPVFMALMLLMGSCDLFNSDDSDSDSNSSGSITISPGSVTLVKGSNQQFTADQSGVEWSLEGAVGNSSINRSGLLTVGTDEAASTLTVKASKYDYATGTAVVTVAAPGTGPSGLTASKPGPAGITLSWPAMEGAGDYTVYRSVNGTEFSRLTTAGVSGTSWTDTSVGSGSFYYYKIRANGIDSLPFFCFAADYFRMPDFTQRKLIPIAVNSKHYYRFAVRSGEEYTIQWHNGNNQNLGRWDSSVRVSAWQNDGTEIFSGAYDGYTSPQVFTSSASGFVTVEVRNESSSTAYNYQIYCYGTDNTADPGTVALPPYKVGAFRVSSPTASSITLTWDSVSDAAKYVIYRANTQTGVPGKMGESTAATYQDNQVPAGGSFWYTIAAVNADGREGCRYQGAFSFAALHYALSVYSGAQTYSLAAGAKHYYRLPVTTDNSNTIEWQNGSNQNLGRWDSSIRVSAWQNDGTVIFSGAYDGYTSPQGFTASSSGFVTIEVRNESSSTAYNYQIYYY